MMPTCQSTLTWRKSTYSKMENCVEVAFTAEAVALRDSKDPHGAALVVSPDAFTLFLRSLAR